MEILLVLFSVLSSSLLQSSFVYAAIDNATIEIFNPLTAFQQCSNGDKKWHICRGKYVPSWYCPSVLEFNSSHVQDIGPCFTCPNAESDCKEVVSSFLSNHNISKDATYDDDWGFNIADKLVLSCQELCEAGKKGDACSTGYFDDDGLYNGNPCTPGSHFCDFASDEEFSMNVSGTCKACPLDPNDCYQDDFVTSIEGRRNCVRCMLDCLGEGASRLTVNGKEIPSSPIDSTIQKSYQDASGPLFNCSNLLLESENGCPGAEGHVCIVDDSVLRGSKVGRSKWQLSNVANKNGCIAIILIGGYGWNDFDDLAIPFVFVSKEDANQRLKSMSSVMAQVEVQVFGSACISTSPHCNNELSCGESKYCFYKDVVVDGEYTQGYCTTCPTFENGEADTAGCFFDRNDYDENIFSMLNVVNVDSCMKACNATLVSGDCKFCPSEVSALDFGVDDKADQCRFCPENDVQYPERKFPLFGKNITCEMVQTFFNQIEVHKDSAICRLAQSMNYLCGCNGTGYAGANTQSKQVMLVWIPRGSAILSLGGSMFIICDTLRTSQKRAKLINQLLSTLSLFDMIWSSAYALTTLPTPKSDEIYGAKGNMRSCTAQGFFIQFGAIACFLNVSLALYYLLTVKYCWTEQQLKRKHVACFLFISPIGIGLVYSFILIPFYDNIMVWCLNTARWWPEIPIILAVIATTGIMGTLCHHVWTTENQTAQYRNNVSRLSKAVFEQSCWFLAAFYMTWMPYLTLKSIFTSGKGYNNYGLVLSAATLIPLQGFWNSLVYIRPRYLSKIVAHVSSSFLRISSFLQRISQASVTEQSALNTIQLSELHDQLQVVQVDDTDGMSSHH